jgi:hypothetical protein
LTREALYFNIFYWNPSSSFICLYSIAEFSSLLNLITFSLLLIIISFLTFSPLSTKAARAISSNITLFFAKYFHHLSENSLISCFQMANLLDYYYLNYKIKFPHCILHCFIKIINRNSTNLINFLSNRINFFIIKIPSLNIPLKKENFFLLFNLISTQFFY